MKYRILMIAVTIFAAGPLSAAHAQQQPEPGGHEGNGTGDLAGPVVVPYSTDCADAGTQGSDCKPDGLAPWRAAFNQAGPLKLSTLPKTTFCLENSVGFKVDTGLDHIFPVVCFSLDRLIPEVGHMASRPQYYNQSNETPVEGALRWISLNSLQKENGEWVSYWVNRNFHGSSYTFGYSKPDQYSYDVYGTFKLTFHQTGSTLLIKVELCPLADSDIDGTTNGWHAPIGSPSGYFERAYIMLDIDKDRVK